MTHSIPGENPSVTLGIPSYNEGVAIVRTLDSLLLASDACRLTDCLYIVSDSSKTRLTVEAAETWAAAKQVRMKIDRSESRRGVKQARNVILEMADSDLLVHVDADVAIPASGLSALISSLTAGDSPEVAVGLAILDPLFRGSIRSKPSAWQMKVTNAVARRMPRNTRRAEGCFFGMRKSFYSGFRYGPDDDSIPDDVELALFLEANDIPVGNVVEAVAHKIPAQTIRDFCLQTARSRAAKALPRNRREIARAAVLESLRDPVGAGAYIFGKLMQLFRFPPSKVTKDWDVAYSTKSLN